MSAARTFLRVVAGLGLVAALVACSSSEQEVQAWMQQQRAQTKPKVEELPEPKKFTPQAYTETAATDPFSPQKLAVALKQEARLPNSLLAAEMNRRREPLESYPLDSMSMVGSVAKGQQPMALLKVDNTSSVATPLAHFVWRLAPGSRDQLRLSLTRSYRTPSTAQLIARPVFYELVRGTNGELATGVPPAVDRLISGTGRSDLEPRGVIAPVVDPNPPSADAPLLPAHAGQEPISKVVAIRPRADGFDAEIEQSPELARSESVV